MGGMCSGGTMKRSSEYREKSSGFSGKLKSVKSFSKQKDDSYEYPDVEVSEKMQHSFDSGELRMSISRELKPSTPVRTGANKRQDLG